MSKEQHDPKTNLNVWKWLLSGLADSAFLISWLILQWVVGTIGKLFPITSNIEKFVYATFEVLFAYSTLAPIVFFIIEDTLTMINRFKNINWVKHER